MKYQNSLQSLPEAARAPFDVIALVASAGGLEAIDRILRDLPPGFPAAVLVAQHLGANASSLIGNLGRHSRLPVAWAKDGASITPGLVQVCPPSTKLEVLPDGTCSLTHSGVSWRDRPLDFLLESLADSFGPRALGVVLTGMGKDGALGARALKQAGGTVLVQSENTAAEPAMPLAAIEIGAASLILPLHEIGPVIVDVMSGGRFPRPRTEIEAIEALFAGPGEAREVLRRIDWSTTPLGPVMTWPQSLRTMVSTVLACGFSMSVLWGQELIMIYNDAFIPILGPLHPSSAGLPVSSVWVRMGVSSTAEIEQVLRAGKSLHGDDVMFEVNRRGFVEEAYLTYSSSPIYDEGGKVAGVLDTSTETTSRVLFERRLSLLRALSMTGTGVETAQQACERAARVLAENPKDLPFALFYLLDERALRTDLVATVGLEKGSPAAPYSVDLRDRHPAWPLAKAIEVGAPFVVDDLAMRFHGFHTGPWPEAPASALLLPLRPVAEDRATGVLVVGLSARLPFDATYRDFLELVATQVGANLAEAHIRQKERLQLDSLTELDRAKTEFFSNVSHEFRTPLTLLLGPIEDLLRHRERLPTPLIEDTELASRNAHRLLNLVDTLLDFSQIEAGRLQAHFEATDLAALTADIASIFRSAVERAGLQLRVECSDLPEPVWVDREMWEKIVSNLLSNALKFTFEGEIAVELNSLPQHAELTVRDTGVGIPKSEQPHLFKRFHRVRGTRARTQEGAGIGLALVYELVRQHQGRVRVRSVVGKGSAFTVWIPSGRRPEFGPPLERAPMKGKATFAAELAKQAIHWTGDPEADKPRQAAILDGPFDATSLSALRAREAGARVLVVDDNPDMRDYFCRLLSEHWQVESASDGKDALIRARRTRPDLIISDVMMPNLDGFAMLEQIRQDDILKAIPVILVTARAGEEAAIEGLLAGADDYLVKPLSARELVARVGAQLELTRMRSQSQRQIREILDIMPAGVYTCDVDGRLTFYNRRAVELWGREPNPHDHRWALRGAWRVYQHGRPLRPNTFPVTHVLKTGEAIVNRELVIERPDHSRIDILVNVSPMHDANGAVIGVVSVFHNITEHKRAEEALQWHHKLTMAMEATKAGWCDWDWVTGETLWSENGKRILGFKTGEDARHAEGWLQRVHPEDLPRVEADARLAAAEHRDFYCEYRIIHPDGEIRHVLSTGRIFYDENDRPVRSTGLIIDITDRKLTEERLRRSELQLKSELGAMIRLHELVTRLLGCTDLRIALEEVLNAAITLLGADMGNVQLLNPRNSSLEIVVHRGFRKDFLDYFKVVRVGEGAACGRALEWGERVLIEDVQIDQAFEPHRVIAASAGFRAMQSTPLMSRSGKLLGILSTHFRKPHLPSERDLRILDLYARQAADFIERVRREEILR